jgi:DNA topoisomerase-1
MAKSSAKAAKALIIVESPAKAKTIGKYVGNNFTVCASVGHIMDLPKNQLGVDIEKNFEPQYVVIDGKQKYISEIKKAAKEVDTIYLAPDPDREGEAIAWHILERLSDGDPSKKFYRVLFNEITKKAVEEAIANPGELNLLKYESQQARRILDRLVGYKLSPLLWDKIRRGLSAGRVQSVALRLICEREAEIEKFKAEEYWSIEVTFAKQKSGERFLSRLIEIKGEKLDVNNQKLATSIKNDLEKQAYEIIRVEEKNRVRNPFPPFITSRMQQEAFRKHRFSAKKTMMLAQHLYEGVELGSEGPVGLITYMRTDSTRISPDALTEARTFILQNYGEKYTLATPRLFKLKKGAQDAHEAIRPTSLQNTPDKVKDYLDKDHFRLYELIWNRFLSSQMQEAVYSQKTIDIQGGDYLLRTTGSTLLFDGFLRLYDESKDDASADEKAEGQLPDFTKGEHVDLKEIDPKQHFTVPPPRFTDSTLIRELEDKGVGRPSTYASIISNIQDKDYTIKEGVAFKPTELGRLVNTLLVESFPHIIDVTFTAQLEDQLDLVEEGKQNWKTLLKDFYTTFEVDLNKAKLEMRDVKREEKPTDFICEKCSKPMVIKWGKNGHFIACSGYPDCKNTKEFKRGADGTIELVAAETSDEKCDICGSAMNIKQGRYGKFLACTRYPECSGTKSISTGVACQNPGCDGQMVEKRSRNGRTFFGCNRYPKCTFALWDRPVAKPCPMCNATFLVQKVRKAGSFIQCNNKECSYKENPDG